MQALTNQSPGIFKLLDIISRSPPNPPSHFLEVRFLVEFPYHCRPERIRHMPLQQILHALLNGRTSNCPSPTVRAYFSLEFFRSMATWSISPSSTRRISRSGKLPFVSSLIKYPISRIFFRSSSKSGQMSGSPPLIQTPSKSLPSLQEIKQLLLREIFMILYSCHQCRIMAERAAKITSSKENGTRCLSGIIQKCQLLKSLDSHKHPSYPSSFASLPKTRFLRIRS
mgnify:CR=1 FL=1